MTHTPGPWHTEDRADDYQLDAGYIADSTGTDVAIVTFADGNIMIAEANARLISVAPELLALLQQIVEEITGPDYEGTCSERALTDANAVLTRVKERS
jgi:hypothetical protein